MHLPPPDPLSIIVLYIAAIIMAANQALSASPGITAKFPALKMGGMWNYVPAALLTLVFLIWLFRAAMPAMSAPISSALGRPPGVPSSAMRGDRVYVPDSWAQKYEALVASGATEAQMSAFLQPEVGRWIHLDGKLSDLYALYGGWDVLIEPSPKAKRNIQVTFTYQWSDQLAQIKRGDDIQLDAFISVQGNQPPSLSAAELR